MRPNDPYWDASWVQSPLDRYSEEANGRFLEILARFPGVAVPEHLGGGSVSGEILGAIVSGDLIDSCDKVGGVYPAMQRFEWRRYISDYGLVGGEGKLPWPVYELHGNHDGPQGDTFVVDDIIARNKRRPGIIERSENGLHYSWA